MARGKATLFALTPEAINWQQKTVRAHFFREGKWQVHTVPLPDVIYNRYLCGRAVEFGPRMRMFRKRLAEHGIALFNRSYFNKQDVFRRLLERNQRPAVSHLPETIEQPTPQKIAKLCEAHQQVFLKPVGGFAGYGIYRLISPSEREARVHFHRGRKPLVISFANRAEMIRYVQKKTRNFRKYIAQQGIALLRHGGCPIDFRVHVNRSGGGGWAISGIGAKKAGRGSVTTHIRTGGSVFEPLRLLKYFFRHKANEVLSNLRQTALVLADSIARTSVHPIGELGFDLGIDTEGKIWMFEANSKPGRSIFKHPGLRGATLRCDRHLLAYSIFLGEQRGEAR